MWFELLTFDNVLYVLQVRQKEKKPDLCEWCHAIFSIFDDL